MWFLFWTLNTGIPCFAIFYLIVLCIYCVFSQIEDLWQPCVKQVCQHHFYNSISHFMSVTFWQFSYFKLFRNYICYGDLRPVIFDVAVVIVFGHLRQCPCKTVNLIEKCACSDCSTDRPFLHLFPSSQSFLFPKTQQH